MESISQTFIQALLIVTLMVLTLNFALSIEEHQSLNYSKHKENIYDLKLRS